MKSLIHLGCSEEKHMMRWSQDKGNGKTSTKDERKKNQSKQEGKYSG